MSSFISMFKQNVILFTAIFTRFRLEMSMMLLSMVHVLYSLGPFLTEESCLIVACHNELNKTCVKRPLKKDKRKILTTNGS